MQGLLVPGCAHVRGTLLDSKKDLVATGFQGVWRSRHVRAPMLNLQLLATPGMRLDVGPERTMKDMGHQSRHQ